MAVLLAAVIVTSCSPFTGRCGYAQWSDAATGIQQYLTGRFKQPKASNAASKALYEQKMNTGVAALAAEVQLPGKACG